MPRSVKSRKRTSGNRPKRQRSQARSRSSLRSSARTRKSSSQGRRHGRGRFRATNDEVMAARQGVEKLEEFMRREFPGEPEEDDHMAKAVKMLFRLVERMVESNEELNSLTKELDTLGDALGGKTPEQLRAALLKLDKLSTSSDKLGQFVRLMKDSYPELGDFPVIDPGVSEAPGKTVFTSGNAIGDGPGGSDDSTGRSSDSKLAQRMARARQSNAKQTREKAEKMGRDAFFSES